MNSRIGILAAFVGMTLLGCANISDLATSALAVAVLDGEYLGIIAYTETTNGEEQVIGESEHRVNVEAIAPWRVRITSDLIGKIDITVVCENTLSNSDPAALLDPSSCPNLTGSYVDLVVESIAEHEITSVELVSFAYTDQWVLNIEYFKEAILAHFTSTNHHPSGFL